MQNSDQVLTFSLPFAKVSEVIVLDEGVLMVVHHNFAYAVVRLGLLSSEIFCHGQLPTLCKEIKKYDRSHIIFINANKLQIFNWVDKLTILSVSIPFSQIYHNSFHYFVSSEYIAFWKQSFLNNQENYSYQIQIYKRNGFNSVKKYRLEEKSACQLSLIKINQAPEIVLYETEGYSIIVSFIELKVFHQIKSIYKLLLVSAHVDDKMILQLGFTHNQLSPDTQLCYELTPDYLLKFYKKIESPRNLVYNEYFSIQLPDIATNYSKPNLTIQVRYNYKKKLKYLLILHQMMTKSIETDQKQKLPQTFSRYFIEMFDKQ